MILKDFTWPARQKCRNAASVAGRLYGRRLHLSVFAMLVLAVLPQTALTRSRGEASPFLCQGPSKAAQVWPSKIAHLAEVTSL